MQNLKTIIVDDNKIYRQSLKMALSRCTELPNILIEEATDGLNFLQQIEKKQPSFILMDIKMPRMNGIEATRLAIEKYPDLKIIAISTLDDYHSIKEMKKAGAKAFLVKGFDKQLLIATITKVLKGNEEFFIKV